MAIIEPRIKGAFIWHYLWFLIFLFLIFFIGARFEVGGDWDSYYRIYTVFDHIGFTLGILRSDVGYMVINWLSFQLGAGVWGVNTVCAAIFLYGLRKFSFSRTRPALVLAIALPYLIIVVSMGYTRQSVALGIILISILQVEKGQLFRALLLIALAATFHKTAVLLAPIAVLAVAKRSLFTYSMLFALIPIAYLIFLDGHVDRLHYIYIEREYNSSGAFVRLSIGVVAAIIYLLFLRNYEENESKRRLWSMFSIASLLLLAALPFSPSSTLLDRVAVYFIPLQLYVFSVFPENFKGCFRTISVLVILLSYFATLLIWLFYANNSQYWIPYQNSIFI
nr:EpsG family protein [Halomonas alkalisoli]